jgi:hypothetical protein
MRLPLVICFWAWTALLGLESPDSEVVAYQVIDYEGREFAFRVTEDATRMTSKLVVIDKKENRPVIEFDSLGRGLLSLFPMEVTEVFQGEMVTIWGDYAQAQLVIFSLAGEPREIFRRDFEGRAFFEYRGPNEPIWLRFVKESVADSPQETTLYQWSKESSGFVLRERTMATR